jgi:hypothetical protein
MHRVEKCIILSHNKSTEIRWRPPMLKGRAIDASGPCPSSNETLRSRAHAWSGAQRTRMKLLPSLD